MGRVVVWVGPSCSGKSTTEDYFINKGWASRIVQCTTRAPRDYEIDGIHYHFRTVQEFHDFNCFNVIEITPEWLYGILPETLDTIKNSNDTFIYSVINMEFAQNMMEHICDERIPALLVYFNIDKDIRVGLMKARGDSEEDIRVRLEREDHPDMMLQMFTPDIEVTELNEKIPELLYKSIEKQFIMEETFLKGEFQ